MKSYKVYGLAAIVLVVTVLVWVLIPRGGNSLDPSNKYAVEGSGIVEGKRSGVNRNSKKIKRANARGSGKRVARNNQNPTRSAKGAADRESDVKDRVPELAMSVEERGIYDGIQKAMDDGNAATVVELCRKIDYRSNRELREQAVTALGWFDGKTMSELTPFLADPDEDIASDALFQWQEALHEIESEAARASVVGQAMGILNDENALRQLAMELNTIDEKLAVDTLVQVIAGKNPAGVAAGKEAYEFVTGEEFTTPEAANKWLQENYSPPED